MLHNRFIVVLLCVVFVIALSTNQESIEFQLYKAIDNYPINETSRDEIRLVLSNYKSDLLKMRLAAAALLTVGLSFIGGGLNHVCSNTIVGQPLGNTNCIILNIASIALINGLLLKGKVDPKKFMILWHGDFKLKPPQDPKEWNDIVKTAHDQGWKIETLYYTTILWNDENDVIIIGRDRNVVYSVDGTIFNRFGGDKSKYNIIHFKTKPSLKKTESIFFGDSRLIDNSLADFGMAMNISSYTDLL
ncbi:putative membrane protein [Wickerhamomyces ciferrii]|uniref:Membrane protein n=1 Tax=Wickerhamomyces ciferrii (strain ATCC 14091 / BCRC 22168 / CBS 111 / JCM 3599 / NBRC 0793 / NRRL Y-1031 F-60-10) TaxID=1206466 RepID=K0KP14_WICCF|nr:uncharacterized protein BN7_2393 [Wickerhamomyces ciferrii]CCH42848.1 putative membrane protein [Wickerhamomyces ciferrii]